MIKDIIFQRSFPRLAYRVLAWHVLYSLTRNPSPLACGFYISNRCNFRCTFCNIWRMRPGFQMPLPDSRRLIGELGAMGLIYFSISGGEPLMVPYVFDLLAHAKKSGILYTHIVSNGFLMDDEKAKKLHDADVSEISFSIDGEERIHDENRGMKGAFQKVIEAVHLVKRYAPRTRIVLNSILDSALPENAVHAVQIAEQLGVQIKVQPANDHPSFGVIESAQKAPRTLSSSGKIKILDAIDLIQGYAHVANSKPFLKNYKLFILSPENDVFAGATCLLGYHHVEVFNNKVFPCLEGLDWDNGFDISLKPVKEVVRSEPYLNKVRDLKTCKNCARNYYVCYYEPRLNFPIWNYLKSRLIAK